jgi:ankyrin repeat protein
VKELLRAKANPNSVSDAEWTPLNTAANKGHLDVVKFLVEKEQI